MPRISGLDETETRTRHLTALALSLTLHLILFSFLALEKKTRFFQNLRLITAVRTPDRTPLANQPPVVQTPDVPLIFVDVSSPDETPPPQTPYYSDKNSRAANPKPELDSTVPKVDGTQDKVIRTADQSPRVAVAEPVPPPVEKLPEPEKIQPQTIPEVKAESGLAPGNLAMNKAAPEPRKQEAVEVVKPQVKVPQARPRKLREVQQTRPGLAGQKVNQPGGVPRARLEASLDVRETSFGAYDRRFIEAVQQRWYDLLDTGTFSRERSGRVSIAFRLTMDGRISNMHLLEEDVGTVLAIVCQRAVLDPQPYGPWPNEMRQAVSKNYREITFTFYYQ